MLRFGWYIPTHGDATSMGDRETFIPPDIGLFMRVARAAEAAGFEFALVPVVTTCYEAWISTAMMAAKTERLKMLVAARPGLIAPTLMAKMVSTFDQLTEGRIFINLIAGGGQAEMAADGVYFDHDARYDLMDETVALMKRAWAEPGTFDWHGKHHRVEGAYVFPKPYQQPHPPFYIGGISPAAVDVGAKHANVYLFWGNTPERIAGDIADVRAAAARHGRVDQIRFGVRMQVLVRETEAEAREAAEALIATASERSKAGRYTGLGSESAADGRMREIAQTTAQNNFWLSRHLYAGLTTVRHGAGVMVVGNPAQVASTLEEYIALGCTEFCLSGYPHDVEAERFGRMVMPFFRARLAPLA